MRLGDLFYEIRTALSANKARSALTILGIVIGIAAVVTLTSLIEGMKVQLLSDLGADQARSINVNSSNVNLDTDDLEYIEDVVNGAENATASIMGSANVSTPTSSLEFVSVMGTMPSFMKAMSSNFPLKEGRHFVDSDDENMRQVVILGTNTVKKLYGSETVSVVGNTVTIGTDNYSVIGVVESSSMMSMGQTADVYVPFRTAHYRVIGSDEFMSFVVMAEEGADVNLVKDNTLRALEKRYPYVAEDTNTFEMGGEIFESAAFSAITQKDMLDIVESVYTAFSVIVASVAGISLLVGGVGIMNMMLTTVTERIREIGLRKAVGAKAADISRQFLGESVLLCLLGGLLGLIFGYIGGWIGAGLVGLFVPDMPIAPVITPSIAAIAFGVSALIGVVFGYTPARNAARLDPVESLRHQ